MVGWMIGEKSDKKVEKIINKTIYNMKGVRGLWLAEEGKES